jgi:hypothetical protein
MIDEDIIQRIKVVGIFLLQVYKVTTGTMLSLFIPQSCSIDDVDSSVNNSASMVNDGSRICSLKENFDNADGYHKTVLYWNAFSWVTFFTYYMIELRREEWSIKYLDIDNDKPDNALKKIIVKEPQLDKKMDSLNLWYYRTLLFNCGVYGINLGLSAKLVKDGYHSSSTISCFASFSLLVLMKLYNSLEVARQSIKNDKMMSAYMSEFVSFNVLDKDYVEAKEKRLRESVPDPEKGPEIIFTDEPPENAEKPEVSSLEKPEVSSLEKPVVSSLEKPVVSSLEKPEVSSLEKPVIPFKDNVTLIPEPQPVEIEEVALTLKDTPRPDLSMKELPMVLEKKEYP